MVDVQKSNRVTYGKIKELATLYEVSKLLASVLSLSKASNLTVKTTARMMRVKACNIRLFGKAAGEMVLKAVYGLRR